MQCSQRRHIAGSPKCAYSHLQDYGQQLLDAGVSLWDACLAGMDGERDPRGLLAAFALARSLMALYSAQPSNSLAAGQMEVGAAVQGLGKLHHTRIEWPVCGAPRRDPGTIPWPPFPHPPPSLTRRALKSCSTSSPATSPSASARLPTIPTASRARAWPAPWQKSYCAAPPSSLSSCQCCWRNWPRPSGAQLLERACQIRDHGGKGACHALSKFQAAGPRHWLAAGASAGRPRPTPWTSSVASPAPARPRIWTRTPTGARSGPGCGPRSVCPRPWKRQRWAAPRTSPPPRRSALPSG